jgi:hypothetical protein
MQILTILFNIWLGFNLLGFVYYIENNIIRILPRKIPLFVQVIVPTLLLERLPIELSPVRLRTIELARSAAAHSKHDIVTFEDAMHFLRNASPIDLERFCVAYAVFPTESPTPLTPNYYGVRVILGQADLYKAVLITAFKDDANELLIQGSDSDLL